jgi:glycosyltransferase involved in cell wall biosynthesis
MAERDSSYPFDLRFILRRFLALFADMIICNSQNGRLYWLSKNAAAHKIHVIPNMVVPQRGHLSDSIKGKPIVVYAGRLEAQKNVIVLAKAYCQLSTAYPDGRFFMIGDGSLRQEIEDIFMKAGIHENVSVLPFQKHIIHYFSAADVFVNVSLHEGLPNTVLENILLENKIVVSDIPEHRDIMGPEHPFYINDFTDFDKVTLGIKKAIESTENMDYMHFARNRLKLMQPQIIADSYYELFVQLGG